MALTDYYKLVDNIRQLEIQLTMVESNELASFQNQETKSSDVPGPNLRY